MKMKQNKGENKETYSLSFNRRQLPVNCYQVKVKDFYRLQKEVNIGSIFSRSKQENSDANPSHTTWLYSNYQGVASSQYLN